MESARSEDPASNPGAAPQDEFLGVASCGPLQREEDEKRGEGGKERAQKRGTTAEKFRIELIYVYCLEKFLPNDSKSRAHAREKIANELGSFFCCSRARKCYLFKWAEADHEMLKGYAILM